MPTQWGRKESIIWPPHSPIYTYGAAFFSLILLCSCMWCRFTFGTSSLQQAYTPAFLKSWASGSISATRRDKYRLMFVTDNKGAVHAAQNDDVVSGKTVQQDGKALPLAVSAGAQQRGIRSVFRGAEQSYNDAALHTYLQHNIFAGESLWDIYQLPIFLGLIVFAGQLPFSIKKDIARRREMKYGRRLKGPRMLTPKEFQKEVKGDGIGFVTTEAKGMMRIPRKVEDQHIEIIGDTGGGKTTLIIQILRQVQSREHAAIIHDPAGEYMERFYDEKRGDIVLNPLDERCPYWGPSEELRHKAEAKTFAKSLYQPNDKPQNDFFITTPQRIFAHLLACGPTPRQLADWMANPSEIDVRVRGTEMATMIGKDSPAQRNGVLSSLSLVADSLRMLPTKEQAKDRIFCATEWAKQRKGWIFITSRATEREALQPLQSLWIDWLVLRLLHTPDHMQVPVWFVIDELASLQRLPQLHTALTENRKSKNPIVLGFQGKSQLEVIYGHIAEVMLSQPATKVFLKTTEHKAAEWISKTIGSIEIERMKETHFDGSRSGRNFTLDRQVEPLVMDSEISGLEDLHGYMKLRNNVARFQFHYLDLPKTQRAFIPRRVEDDELHFDPLTLRPVSAPSIVDLEPGLPSLPRDGERPRARRAAAPTTGSDETPSLQKTTSSEEQTPSLAAQPVATGATSAAADVVPAVKQASAEEHEPANRQQSAAQSSLRFERA